MTFIHRYLGLAGAALVLASCGVANQVADQIADVDGGVSQSAAALAKQCGIDVTCADGIAQGNASISGVASVDTFFASVLSFQARADHVSADIDVQLSAIRADFGIDASADLQTELTARIAENVQNGIRMKSEPARCGVDAHAALAAQAKCDASIDPGKATMLCNGSCDVQSNVDVDCGADAQLSCTFNPPTGACSGACTGSCEIQLSAMAKCEGTCHGACSGTCSAYADSNGTDCAGACDGMCQGSCETDTMTTATCTGSCRGDCTLTAPSTKCESTTSAHCEASASGMVACNGRCEGQVVPPKGKAECEASARAQTKLDVECTPPRIVLDYELRTDTDADARARFVAAIENLHASLPGLSARLEQAKSVSAAGGDLVNDARVAVKGGVQSAEKAVAKGDLRTIFGLACAARELDNVADTIKDSNDRLAKSVHDCTALKSAVGAQ